MARPKVGVSMLYCFDQPFSQMLEQIPKAGTDYIEMVDDGPHALTKERVSTLKTMGSSYDLKYSVHAPFIRVNIAFPSRPMLNAALKRLKESIVNACALDCRMWVFHPGLKASPNMSDPYADWLRNLESVRLLFRFAHDHGVEAAIENVTDPFIIKTAEDFKRFFSEIDENISLVLDTGHANITGDLGIYLNDLSKKIVHVHAHDNHGKTDEHLGIGFGNIDWKSVTGMLKRVSFDKVVMIESAEHVGESLQRLKQLLT